MTNCQLLDYQSDISDLLKHHPELAYNFDSLRLELDCKWGPKVFRVEYYPEVIFQDY